MEKGILLIAEDEIDLSEILVEMLTPYCAQIYTASNGKQALEIYNKNPTIDAILSDINMPIMTGFQFLARLRESGNTIPFVTLTAYGDQENMRESMRLNATDFLTKPFDRKELTETITKLLKYGVQLKKNQQNISSLFQDLNIPNEKINTIKKYYQSSNILRVENSKYSQFNTK